MSQIPQFDMAQEYIGIAMLGVSMVCLIASLAWLIKDYRTKTSAITMTTMLMAFFFILLFIAELVKMFLPSKAAWIFFGWTAYTPMFFVCLSMILLLKTFHRTIFGGRYTQDFYNRVFQGAVISYVLICWEVTLF